VGNSLGRTQNNDLFLGQVSCTNLTLLKNSGTNQNVQYSRIEYDYLATSNIAPGIFYTAAPLQLMGNTEDIFVSVNSADNVGYLQDFQQSSFRMKAGQAKPFLQDQMIDVGEKASPCFFDIDADGDLDLLVGHAGYRKVNDVKAGIYLYENQSGVYVFKTADYLGLGTQESLTDLVLQVRGNHLLVVGQSSLGTKVYQMANQQLIPLNLELNFGELPIFSPWGDLVLTKMGRIRSASNADWGQLSKVSWQLRTCQFADIDGDGTAEFVGIDVDGQWHVGNFNDVTNSINWRTADFTGFTVGRNTRLQVADLTGDGRNDLVVGTGAGGIYLIENKSSSPVWESLKNQSLQVWPNPHHGTIQVLTNKDGTLEIYNAMGQFIDSSPIQAGRTYQFSHDSMHFVRFIDLKGQISTRKIQRD
jgi:hypothetical protein